MNNIFDQKESEAIINRFNELSVNSERLWGTMSVSQMLAHCNVMFAMVYTDKYAKPNILKRLLLKVFIKNFVVGEKPYAKNVRTAPQFIIKVEKNLETEKQRLTEYIAKTQELGEDHFHNKEYLSFGVLTKTEWNNMFYKHLDHHLKQFGV